jgi:hypothetical protein
MEAERAVNRTISTHNCISAKVCKNLSSANKTFLTNIFSKGKMGFTFYLSCLLHKILYQISTTSHEVSAYYSLSRSFTELDSDLLVVKIQLGLIS